jgi:hypothetical protein
VGFSLVNPDSQRYDGSEPCFRWKLLVFSESLAVCLRSAIRE